MRYRVAKLLLVLALAVTAGAFALPAVAQTTGSIDGTVSDGNGQPLPGVKIEVKSGSLQGMRTIVTDSQGRFRVPVLPPGTYTVTASLTGFRSAQRTGIVVSLDGTSNITFKLDISKTADIVVTGELPMVDTQSTTSGLNITEQVIQKLPEGRNYASSVQINPGVSRDNADTQGRAQSFTIYGATSVENQYLVDGINTTNVIRGFQGKALTQEFVEEVQVKASGYEAEFGRAMGGIVNVVTKSGGNQFKGDVFGYFDMKSLIAARKGDATSDVNYTDQSKRDVQDYGADLGGFLMKDRIWFFGAYNRISQQVDQVPLAGTGLPNAGVVFPISYAANIWSAKLTIRPTESTTIVGTAFGDPETRTGTIRNFTADNPIIQQGTRDIGATDYAGLLTQLFGSGGLVNARYAYHQDRYETQGLANGIQYDDFRQDPNNPIYSGGFGNIRGYRQNNFSSRQNITGSGSIFLSTHEVKLGIDYENNKTTAIDYYTGGQLVSIYNCPTPAPGVTPCAPGNTFYYQHSYYSTSTSNPVAGYLPNGNTVVPHIYRLGFFAQDSWRVMPNLTVNLGIRYDQEDVRDYNGDTILNENGYPFKLKNEWQPRVGIAWDVKGDGTSKLGASYGRFYYALPTDLTVRSYGAKVDVNSFNYSPTSLAQDPTAPLAQQAQGGFAPEQFQNNLKGYYQDEVTLGYERAFDPTFSLGVKGTFRYLQNVIEDRCDFDTAYPEANGNTCVIINPGSDSPYATGQGIHTCTGLDYGPQTGPPSNCTGQSTVNVAVPAARRQYISAELVAKKRVGENFWGQASFIWAQLKGNYDGAARIGSQPGPGNGQTDPGINADYDYATFLNNAYGKLNLDRPFAFRLDGTYTWPFGLSAGLSGFVYAGAPRNEIGYFNSQYGSELFLIPRGTNGRENTLFDINLSAQYALKLSAVTVTLFAQAYNLINKQTITGRDTNYTVLPPGNPDEFNPSYLYAAGNTGQNGDAGVARLSPRLFRFGARISF
jgi:outer membrane receptor protein involved in Fe transport